MSATKAEMSRKQDEYRRQMAQKNGRKPLDGVLPAELHAYSLEEWIESLQIADSLAARGWGSFLGVSPDAFGAPFAVYDPSTMALKSLCFIVNAPLEDWPGVRVNAARLQRAVTMGEAMKVPVWVFARHKGVIHGKKIDDPRGPACRVGHRTGGNPHDLDVVAVIEELKPMQKEKTGDQASGTEEREVGAVR